MSARHLTDDVLFDLLRASLHVDLIKAEAAPSGGRAPRSKKE